MKNFLILIFFTFNFNVTFSQYYQSAIDTVFWFYPGEGQNLGQNSVYFPSNIFRLPDTNASELVPSSSPYDICSIGIGGEICVGFKNFEIVDSDGADFTIFENAFLNPITKIFFAEPAVVSVSYDGTNFFEFPWDYQTLEGCAGTKPTNGKGNPFNPEESGGNSFDLSSFGIKKARYIKIKDICNLILNDTSHPFYSPLLTGFDLDCVVGIHLLPIVQSFESLDVQKIKISISSQIVTIFNAIGYNLKIFDFLGNLVGEYKEPDENNIDLSNFAPGFYLLCLQNSHNFILYKLLKTEYAVYCM